jgi:NAD(P)H dehydrogenase (quinone)
MTVLVILGHPNKLSFNCAIAVALIDRLKFHAHEVIFHNLYDEKFDAVIPEYELSKNMVPDKILEKHCLDLQVADAIIIVHPNWWGQPPAIMKGWIDRVIRPGVAYEFKEGDSGEGIPVGLLKAKLAIVFNTSDTAETRENKVFGDPLEAIWRNCIFGFCGINKFYRKTFRIIVNSSIKQRQQWLRETEEIIDKYFSNY